MGAAKAALPWGGGSLLDHVVGVLGRAVDGPVVVSAGPGDDLPPITSLAPERLLRVDDPERGRGPLTGLALALDAHRRAPEPVAAVFVAAVDLPLLTVELVQRMLDLLAAAPDADVALPHVDGHAQPLAAAWRPAIAEAALRRVAAGEGGFAGLLGDLRVVEADVATLLADHALAAADPGLVGLRDADDPVALAALRALGDA